MKPKIVVVVSADAEWRVIRELFPDEEIQQTIYGAWFETSQFSNSQSPVIVFHQGWGKIAAAGATQYAIDHWQPDVIINLGTCGGFAGEIEKYTIILAEKTLVYDIIEQMGDFEEHIAHYTTEIDLSWLPEPLPQEVVRTLLVSGDRDLIIEEIPQLKRKYGAVAGDWESGAIAWVAARNGVRCLILRGVTDLVGAKGGEAYDGNMDVFVEGTCLVMHKLWAALPGWIARVTRADF